MKRPRSSLYTTLAVALTVGVAAPPAEARRRATPEQMKARIERALTVAQATPEQKVVLRQIGHKAVNELAQQRKSHQTWFNQALALFEAPAIDKPAVEKLRGEQRTALDRAADVIVAAVKQSHQTLLPAQRAAVAEWARAHLDGGGNGRFRSFVVRAMAAHMTDRALDEVGVSQEQRQAIQASVGHVVDVVLDTWGDYKARAEEALALFAAPSLDEGKVQQLRADHTARFGKVGDAVVQLFYDAHGALTPPQRRALTDWIRTQSAQRKARRGHRT
jgi:uncharacterized membrane protein